MSGRFGFRGYTGRQNENSPRKILSSKSTSTSPTVSNPSSLLYDKNDFPSLSENSEQISSMPEVKVLKYSDKLKSSSQHPSYHHYAASFQDSHSKNSFTNQCNKDSLPKYARESGLKDCKKADASYASDFCQPRQLKNHPYEDLTLTKQNYHSKSLSNTTNKTPVLTPNKNVSTQSQLQIPCNKEIKTNFLKNDMKTQEKKSTKQNDHVVKSLNSASNKTSALNCNNSIYYKSSFESPSREIKYDLIFDKAQIKHEGEKVDVPGKTAKKKKRKSKVKRQAALQTGKITVLTPEVHSKIVNQASALNTKNVKSIVTDINDEEEYPELGKSFTPSCQKENSLKKENTTVSTVKEDKISDASAETQQVSKKEFILSNKPVTPEKKRKPDNKAVHPNDPITVTFFDMLMAKNSKTKIKELKEGIATNPSSAGLPKVKLKKGLCHAPNLLDSSCPVVKRGKERENPKPKKPSQLKKIILLDRKLRREQLLQLRSNSNQEENPLCGNTSKLCDDTQAVNFSDNGLEKTVVLDDLSDNNFSEVPVNFQLEDSYNQNNRESLLSNENSVSVSSDESTQAKENCDENISITLAANLKHDSDEATVESTFISTEKHLSVLESNDSLLKSLSDATKSDEVSEKLRAAKILLHTRNFREYCNHLISKDIDDAVHALLDDLARFQDRMHLKDPVKARIRRRMVYGVKEVKKHMKLKKLKCIIIATDIENVETEGGLNDILNDIKSLAADHNIPCVFALARKALGKVCHKPVPVSCIGVFNAEGSEANYKKMVELLLQSKKDYSEILNNLESKITNQEADILFKAKREAPETLHEIRSNILRQYFLLSQSDGSKVTKEMTESSDENN